ncbi:heavy metal translocating P-type ATPase [Cellulomonas sp. C5510]|nr:heavy metal translocating P-type ATPase [Cellulomonas sp. C5510]
MSARADVDGQHGHGTEADGAGSARRELGFAIASGVTYLSGMLGEYVFDLPGGAPLALFLATYVLGGFYTIRSAASSIRGGRFEVDFLMIVAAIGAGLIGKFAEGAVLLFLFSLGHALEEYAMSRATRSINALAALAPRTAMVRLADGQTEERPVEQIGVGDVLVVRPNSRIPSDGFVSAGASAVDQSAVTGESMPVEKVAVDDPARALRSIETIEAAHRVFAGTVNGAGVLQITVTATAADSTLSRVIELVRMADQGTSPTQRFIDRFQRWYVPAVVLGVAATLVVAMVVAGWSFVDGFYLAMTVLVAASPCALAIATPAAVLAGVARAARAGLLVKGGGPLETLGRVGAIAFDKTGTLTWGRPQVASVFAVDEDQDTLVRTVVAVEQLSDHPLAGAIVRDLTDLVAPDDRLTASDLNAVVGRGVRAWIGQDLVEIGSPRMFTEQQIDLPADVAAAAEAAQGDGQTVMVVRRGSRFLGVLGVMDTPRRESGDVLGALRAAGVRRLVMISGDNQQVADAVGRQVGLDTAFGELMPQDKVEHIAAMSAGDQLIAMVGDGVNDAPAMARADVAIAMGAAGSTVALETCDVALMSDDLGRLPFAMRLSRATSRIIRQNLVISLAIVLLLIAATFAGLNIGAVVLIHEGSTLLVVANALRLLRFQPGQEHAGIDHEDAPPRPRDTPTLVA